VLLIVTFRPEFEPGWIGQPHVTPLNLNRLASREVGAMIDHIVGNNPLLARAVDRIPTLSEPLPGWWGRTNAHPRRPSAPEWSGPGLLLARRVLPAFSAGAAAG